jgi:hypothetical protein
MSRNLHFAVPLLFAVLAAAPLVFPQDHAQAQAQEQTYPDDSWIPKGMEALGKHASFHTDVTFDKSMLDLANNVVGDEDTRRVVAKLRGISVHTYRYPEPGLYDPATLDSVRAQYRDRGWKHLVTRESHAAAEHPGRSDVWIRFANGNVEGMVLLVAGEKNINLASMGR